MSLLGVLILTAFGSLLAADIALHSGKIYEGVTVGDVDLSGMTTSEASEVLENHFEPYTSNRSIVVFAYESSEGSSSESLKRSANAQVKEHSWNTDAESLGARIDAEGLAQEAYEIGRANGGLAARFDALTNGRTIAPRALYDTEAIEKLAASIDESIGTPMIDYGIKIVSGFAEVTRGCDGMLVNRETLRNNLSDALFATTTDSEVRIEAVASNAPVHIGETEAKITCEGVNAVLRRQVTLSVNGASWKVDRSTLGSWISTRIEEIGDTFILEPFISEEFAKEYLLKNMHARGNGKDICVTFSINGETPVVNVADSAEIPLVSESATAIDNALFKTLRSNLANAEPDPTKSIKADEPLTIPLTTGQPAKNLSLEEALDLGIIEEISSYTTNYDNGNDSQSRNSNIRLISDILNNSIAKANGGTWSFNETSGERTEEAGFLSAGTIISNEFSTSVGGGICQVATTIFNAVYEAGLPINERHNHSLYIARYPDGRDAAVSWPDLDLIWTNSTSSDILVQCSYTDESVTATLFGISPEYSVETITGQWQESAGYETVVEYDSSLPVGKSYVQTAGSKARSIVVQRIVRDSDGNVVDENSFASHYQSIPEVIVEGTSKSA